MIRSFIWSLLRLLPDRDPDGPPPACRPAAVSTTCPPILADDRRHQPSPSTAYSPAGQHEGALDRPESSFSRLILGHAGPQEGDGSHCDATRPLLKRATRKLYSWHGEGGQWCHPRLSLYAGRLAKLSFCASQTTSVRSTCRMLPAG